MYKHLTYQKVHFFLAALILPIALILTLYNSSVLAGTQVQNRSDQLSDSNAGQVSTNKISFTYTNNTDTVESVLFQFCQNSPLLTVPECDFPVGMDFSSVDFSAQSGNTGFTLSSSPAQLAAGELLLVNNAGIIPDTTVLSSYTFDDITNPSSPGEYFVRIQTFTSNNAQAGTFIEGGGISIAINSPFTVTAIVPPYLTFCGGVTVADLNCGEASGDEIDFGDFSTKSTSDATSQFVIATNAPGGYNVSINGDSMTSGNYVIPSLSTPTASQVGNDQFGVNLVANSIPSVGNDPIGLGIGNPTANYGNSNLYTFNDGDTVVTANNASNYNKFTASYLVNINSGQAIGVYTTTIYYICLANF